MAALLVDTVVQQANLRAPLVFSAMQLRAALDILALFSAAAH